MIVLTADSSSSTTVTDARYAAYRDAVASWPPPVLFTGQAFPLRSETPPRFPRDEAPNATAIVPYTLSASARVLGAIAPSPKHTSCTVEPHSDFAKKASNAPIPLKETGIYQLRAFFDNENNVPGVITQYPNQFTVRLAAKLIGSVVRGSPPDTTAITKMTNDIVEMMPAKGNSTKQIAAFRARVANATAMVESLNNGSTARNFPGIPLRVSEALIRTKQRSIPQTSR